MISLSTLWQRKTTIIAVFSIVGISSQLVLRFGFHNTAGCFRDRAARPHELRDALTSHECRRPRDWLRLEAAHRIAVVLIP